MYLYLITIDNYLKIDSTNNLEQEIKTLIETTSKINWSELSYYETNNIEDINDLIEIINRLFKRFKIQVDNENVTWFSNECYSDIINFIDTEILNENFNLSKRKIFDKTLINKLSTKKKLNYLYFFVFFDKHSEIGKITENDLSLLDNQHINKSESIIIKFDDNQMCSRLFNSMKLDILNQKINKRTFKIDKEYTEYASKLLKVKINIISLYSNLTLINLLDNNIINFGSNTTFLNSKEVCEILNISKQTLSNWRKSGKIKYKQLSARVFQYKLNDIQQILDNLLTKEALTTSLDSLKQLENKVSNPVKNKFENKYNTKKSNASYNDKYYKEKIENWVKVFSYKIAPQKYKKQNFFLNFGNVGIESSPQVMLNNDYILYDYIKKVKIFDTVKETWEYLENLSKEGKEPRIDTSKRIYEHYDKLYLNKLYMHYQVEPNHH